MEIFLISHIIFSLGKGLNGIIDGILERAMEAENPKKVSDILLGRAKTLSDAIQTHIRTGAFAVAKELMNRLWEVVEITESIGYPTIANEIRREALNLEEAIINEERARIERLREWAKR